MSHASQGFRRVLVVGALAGLSILLLLASSGSTSAQWIPGTPQFSPTIDFKLCNDLPGDFHGPSELQGLGGSCVNNTAQGATPDFTFDYDIPAGHLNLSWRVFTLIMSLSSEFSIASAAAIPGPNPDGQTGIVIGGFSDMMSIGLTTNPCNNTIFPDYILYESTTDTGNVIDVDDPDFIRDTGDFPGQADGDSGFVIQYPNITNKFFDPDGDGIDTDGNPATIGDQPVQPHARYAGATNVPPGSSDWPLRQILVFPPGVLKDAFSLNLNLGNSTHPFTSLNPDLGWTMVLISDGPEPDPGSPSPISDFCSPFGAVGTLLGAVDTDGDLMRDTARLTSPAAVGGIDGEGTQLVEHRTVSRRDADSDGLENDFDTCPFQINTFFEDPYVTAGPDTDMIDSVCDPDPWAKNDDQDNDGFLNAQDNCPLFWNPDQAEAEDVTPYNLAASDGGPRADSIGDACDPSPTVADGMFFFDIITDAFCINDDPLADEDGDGWCSTSPGADPDDNDPNVTGEPNQNADGDDYENWLEVYLQTDPRFGCPQVEHSHDAWPPDFDMNRVVNILDVGEVLPPNFGTSVPPASQRLDLTPDGFINILDVGEVLPPVFGSVCTP